MLLGFWCSCCLKLLTLEFLSKVCKRANCLGLHCGFSQPRNSIITTNYSVLAILNTKLASNNHHQIAFSWCLANCRKPKLVFQNPNLQNPETLMQRCKPETVTSQNTLWRRNTLRKEKLTNSGPNRCSLFFFTKNCKYYTTQDLSTEGTSKRHTKQFTYGKGISSTFRTSKWNAPPAMSETIYDQLGLTSGSQKKKISTQQQQQQRNVRRTSLVYQVIEGTTWRRQCTASSLSSRCSCAQCHWPHAIAHTGDSTSLLPLSPLLSPSLLVSRANLQQSPQAWATTTLQILLHTFFLS